MQIDPPHLGLEPVGMWPSLPGVLLAEWSPHAASLTVPLWCAAIAIAAIALAALLRRLRLAGAALLAGVVAGVALGPGVAGRIAPSFATWALAGDPAVVAELNALERERRVARLAASSPALAAADASGVLDELDQRVAAAELLWRSERERQWMPVFAAALGLAAVVLLGSGSATSVRAPIRAHQRAEAVVSAMWWVLTSVGLAAGALWLGGMRLDPASSLLLAAMTCCGSYGLARAERRLARSVAWGGAALVEQASRFASVAALACGASALLVAEAPRLVGLAGIALACLPLGWALRTNLAPFVERVALPALTAIAMASVEPFLDLGASGIFAAVVLYLLFEDGRWLGGWLSHWASGRAGSLAAMRLALAGVSVEPLVVAVVGIGWATGILAPWLVGASLLAATGIALLAKARIAAAERLEALEAESDAARAE